MGKVLGTIAKLAAAAALIVFAPEIALTIGIKAIGAATIAAIGASLALATVSQALFGPSMPKSQLSRLNASYDTTATRKSVFGTTAMNLDIRYQEASGTDQEYVDYIIAVAAHKVRAISEIWFEEKQAWTVGSGVTSTYAGYLTVDVRLEGTSANYISISSGWNSSCRLTGCAYIHLRVKRTGATNKVESPLVGGLPSRITVIGEGSPLYDPRKDSTVSGGSGSHRATDQTTWGSYTDADDCDNPALQLLWWLLGWKINSQLSVGCGVPYTRIDMESFITAANICDESVTLAIGGTQKRYRTSGTASDSDDRMNIINTFLSCMNGTLRDSNGKLALTVMKNDLADYVLDFDEGDVIGEFTWNQTRGLSDSYNKARGRYVDPSTTALYQLVDYPEVSLDSPDGIERVMTIDLPYVEDGRRAQRIAKQVLERNQYRGMFSATFTAKALGCQVGDVVRLSFESLGWSNKLFRVISQEINFNGLVPLALVEENAAIYAWDADDSAPLTPTAPTVYDPLNSPFILGVTDSALTADWTSVTSRPTELTDGRVSSGLASDGTINSNKVLTASIAANNVSKITSANSTTNVAIGSTDTVVQQVTFTTNGGPVLVDASFLNYSQPVAAGAHGVQYYLWCAGYFGTQNYYSTQYSPGGGGTYQFRQQCTLSTLATGLSAGTYTVYLYAKLFNANSQVGTLTADRILTVTELKR